MVDEQLTTEHSAGDVFRKHAKFTKSWVAMFAGDDCADAGTVVDRLKAKFIHEDHVSLQAVSSVFLQIRADVLRLQNEATTLAPLGLTMNEFLSLVAHDPAGQKKFQRILKAVQAARLGCDFVLGGFDERRMPHIQLFPDGDKPVNADRHGFVALGSGAAIALHMLLRAGYRTTLSIPLAMYHLASAKYVAENATVGETTKMFVLTAAGAVLNTDAARMRAVWHDRSAIGPAIEAQLPPFFQI